MSKTYKELTTPDGSKVIEMTDNGQVWIVPTELGNSDYQRYLKWLENPDAEEVTPMFSITTEPPTEQTQEGAE
jgi:hypothetical protein